MLVDRFNQIVQEMPLIAILRGVQPHEVLAIADDLVDVGFRMIEVPLNSPDPFVSIKKLKQHFDDNVISGAGTVTSMKLLEQALAVGAELVVAPNTNPEIISHSVKQGAITIPGFATASEMYNAIDAGAHALKFFPAVNDGFNILAALKSVAPADIPVFAVGGVNSSNISNFLEAGAAGFGIGSNLYKPGINSDELKSSAQNYVQCIRSLLN